VPRLAAGKYTGQRSKDELIDVLRHTFRPESLNRVDETVIFRLLGSGEIERIVAVG
jgi:ATP-dependent Clp protease ATP-binding subunit ClpA